MNKDKQYSEIYRVLKDEYSNTESKLNSFCLAYSDVLIKKEYTVSEIQQITGLRQPEISTGLKHLIERGWVEYSGSIKPDKRSRPAKKYVIVGNKLDMKNYILFELNKKRQSLENKLNLLSNKVKE